jgi:hypothetical protein
MKTSTTLAAASLALLIGVSASLAAEVKTDAQTDVTGSVAVGDTKADVSGQATLGVDISTAGNTPETQAQFYASLTAEQKADLKTKCQAVIANPSNYSAEVSAFCNATAKIQ